MRPTWQINPSYFHYKGCRCQGNHDTSYRTGVRHGDAVIDVLVCTRSDRLSADAAAGISVAACIVGLVLLAYCLYVSWYGRWGLPRLQRVRLFVWACKQGWVMGNVGWLWV